MTFVKTTFTSLLLLLSTAVNAQTANASQSAAVSSAISSYESSLINGPVATSVALLVAIQIPASQIPSIVSNIGDLIPTPTGNLYSWATAPPSTFSTPSWATQLNSGGQSDLQALRTSIVGAEASIVRSVLGVTAAATTNAAATSSATHSSNAAVDPRATNLAGAMGLAIAAGAAVVW